MGNRKKIRMMRLVDVLDEYGDEAIEAILLAIAENPGIAGNYTAYAFDSVFTLYVYDSDCDENIRVGTIKRED